MHAIRSRTSFDPGCLLFLLLLAMPLDAQEQLADSEFKAEVHKPAYPAQGPVVAIDEAHSNFHTADGQYRPFADLLRSDGYRVISSSARFEPGAFAGIDVLIIANALPADEEDMSLPAFTEQECDVLAEWVRSGGSLLFIADHAPFGGTAANLAKRFGVDMGKGWVFDSLDTGGVTTQLVFSRENGLLGSHPILDGRGSEEEIGVIRSFTGQSLSVPDGAVVLMALGKGAREAVTREDVRAEGTEAQGGNASGLYGTRSVPAGGRAQGIAMKFGEGRVVILGEAGMLSAQMIRYPDGREIRFGMNVPGYDNVKFGLNVMHWLSGLLR